MRSIVVPVDGSVLAEFALAPAAELARRHGAQLWLAVVHPWGAEEAAPLAGSADDLLLRGREADYLRELQDRLAGAYGIEAGRRVLEGDRVPALATFASRVKADLVVAATRGRGVLAGTLRLDLALRLAHALACPMLLLKPPRDHQVPVPAGGFRRPVVALDGSRLAEASLGPALDLSDPRQRQLTLCRVITPLAPGLRERRRRALAYLLRISGRLEERGIPVDVRVLARAHAAGAVTGYADLIGADLVAIATQERGPARRAALGSVADAAVRRGRSPILICHSPTKPRATRAPRRRRRSRMGRP
jgi:nucleotide-binding universal stress UspA family protein